METSSKFGSIRKCPNCGATVDTTSMQCTECGYMFQGLDAPLIVKEFEERVNAANMFKRASVIRHFAIPNTQEALFAFLAYLDPLCEDGSTMNTSVANAYKLKFKECLTRAKIAFPDNQTVQVYERLYKSRNKKKRIIIIAAAAFLLLVMIGGVLAACYAKHPS